MEWERIALDEIATRVAEIQSVPTPALPWVAAVVWLYAPYPQDLQEAWTEAAAAVAKLERVLKRRRDDGEAIGACRELLRMYVPERGERTRVRREMQPDGSELVEPLHGTDDLLGGGPRPDRTRFLIALVEVLREHGGLSKQATFAVVADLWPHVMDARITIDSVSRQYWREVERYRKTGVLAPVNLSQVDRLARFVEERMRTGTSASQPTDEKEPALHPEPDELPQDEWPEMPTAIPPWMVKWAETGRPPPAREMGFELDPSMEGFVDALLRGENPSQDAIKMPELPSQYTKAHAARDERRVDGDSPAAAVVGLPYHRRSAGRRSQSRVARTDAAYPPDRSRRDLSSRRNFEGVRPRRLPNARLTYQGQGALSDVRNTIAIHWIPPPSSTSLLRRQP